MNQKFREGPAFRGYTKSPMNQLIPVQGKYVHHHYLIELKLRDINQLFNSMDPSPFQEKDLDQDAEDFLVGWAQEYPLHEPLTLRVHLAELPPEGDAKALIQDAIRHFFTYKAQLNQLEFSRLMREGRISLAIGLSFLASCLALAGILAQVDGGTAIAIVREGLTIVGWVAMWHPIYIYLYEWWPVRRIGKVYQKMSRMSVEVRTKASTPKKEPPSSAPKEPASAPKETPAVPPTGLS